MAALQETKYFTTGNKSISNADLLSIHASMTPSFSSILRTLYQNPNLQHKILATDAHLSITNLSNCISKLETITPSLLKIEKKGRSKFYSLSPAGEQYVEQMLLPNQPAKIQSFVTFSTESSKTNIALETLRQFRETAGIKWDRILFNMLSGNEITENELLNNLFSELVEQMLWFKTQKQDRSLEKIYSVLGQNIIIEEFKDYLARMLQAFYILDPVFQLAKADMKNASFIIDKMFSEITFSNEDLAIADTQLISEAEYNAIYRHLNGMIRDFCQHNYNKKDTIEYWETIYHTNNPILSYIAEKCASLHRPPKQMI